MQAQQAPPKLVTVGVIADALGIATPRVARILRRRPHIRPVALAGNTRLFSNVAIDLIRLELDGLGKRKRGRTATATGQLNADESRQQSEAGQRRVARNNTEGIAIIQRAFLEHLRDIAPEPGSMDTLRASGFELPKLSHLNAIGSAIGDLSRRGLIKLAGVTRGRRLSAHRAKIYAWRLATGGDA